MKQEEYINNQMKILIAKNGYNKAQVKQIALASWNKNQNVAQQGFQYPNLLNNYNPSVVQGAEENPNAGFQAPPNYQNFNPNLNLNTTDYSMTSGYAQPNTAQTFANQNPLPFNQTIPNDIGYKQFERSEDYNKYLPKNTEQVQQDTQQYNDITRYNVPNLYGGIDLEGSLAYAGQGFGEGNAMQAGLGTGLSILKGARNFMTGYSSGKENNRVKREQLDKLYDQNINYVARQQGGYNDNSTVWKYVSPQMQEGGKYQPTNAEMLTNQYVADEGFGNTNVEGSEYIKRAQTGNVQKVIGEPHIKNGKIGEGVDVTLENGDRVLSDYTKIPSKSVKELKERYDLKLKKNATFADAQKAYDKKIGIQKTTDELAENIEKFGKNESVKDETSKRLNEVLLSKQIEESKIKLDVLKQPQSMIFDDLFNMQEQLPKKGNPGELLDKKGKVVEDTNESVSQEGGMINDVAKKYGITPERAHELLSLQQGGEEGQQSNPQEEQVEVNPQQIMEQVAQALQQGADPQQVLQQLVQSGFPQDQAQQLIQQVMQQMQGDQEQVPQEQQMAQEGEYMQQAGKKLVYDVQTGRNVYKDEIRENQHAVEGNAYGKPTPQIALQNLYNNFPDIIAEEFKDNVVIDKLGNLDFKKNLSLNEEQELVRNFQKKADSRMRDSANTIIKNPENFSEKMIDQAKAYIADQTFIEDTKGSTDEKLNVRGFDAKLGNFTSGRYSMGLNLLTPEDLKLAQENGIKTFKQLKASPIYKDLSKDSKERTDRLDKLIGDTNSDYSISEFTVPEGALPNDLITGEPEQSIEQRNITKNAFAMLPENLRLAPSSLDPLAKEQIALQRIDPVKQSIEPYLASAESNRQSDIARVQASGLSPAQQESLLAQGLASSQMASNDAIAKTEQYNADNQFKVDQFNIGQRSKEDITNANYNQVYQGQMLQGLANQERDWRAYYNEGNAQNRQNFKDIEAINLLNAKQDQYAYIPGQAVQFLNNQAPEIQISNTPTQAELDKMTPEQQIKFMEDFATKIKKNNFIKAKQKLG